MEIQTENRMKDVISFLRKGDPLSAQNIISSLFENDLESEELIYTNKCCVFWMDSIKRLNSIEDAFERCEKALLEWKSFQAFISKEKQEYSPALFAVQEGFFSSVLANCEKLLNEKDPLQRAEIHRKAGICYKKLGNFVKARDFLTEANNISPNLSSVLAELADCYSLCGEDRIGKVLFREAFFIDPESIDLDFLDSELIKCLISKTREHGFSGKELQFWIPVYGTLTGILNIKRELSSTEVGRLKTSIYAMENEYKDPGCNSKILTPRMLNGYFWLIDHYVSTNQNSAVINEVLLKIKILDSSVYEAYIK